MSKNWPVCLERGSVALIGFNGLGEFDVLVEGIETDVAPAVGITPT
jgi:hypothetical protein